MSIEALKKAREALQLAVHLLRKYADAEDMGGARFDLTDCKEMLPIFAALAAIDAEAKPVVRMLTDEEVLGAVEDAERSHYRWSNGVRGQQLMPQDSPRFHLVMAGAAKVLSVNGLTIGEQG